MTSTTRLRPTLALLAALALLVAACSDDATDGPPPRGATAPRPP